MGPVRPAENLLEHVAENALDDDYYVIRAGEPYGERPVGTVAVGFVVALLAVLITVAAVQTQTSRPGSELERRTLAADVGDRREVLVARESAAQALRQQVATLQGGSPAVIDDPSARVVSGAEPVSGPGVVVTIANSPDGSRAGRVTAKDVIQVVNGLWYAGAEAIAVGGERLTAMSSIGSLDGAIQVNFTRVDEPVRIVALGDGATLRSRIESNAAGEYLDARARNAGITVDVSPSESERLPAAPDKRAEPQQAEALVGADEGGEGR